MSSFLFAPLSLRELELPNRIVVSPMCQYSAVDGTAGDWHFQHLGHLALSGAGLLMIEATAVERSGRITCGCLGLYSDENEAALKRVLEAIRSWRGPTKLGIQLAHAGRKGSQSAPWQGGRPLKPEEGAYETFAPSAIPFSDGWHTPTVLDREGLGRIKDAFVAAARRAARLGLELVELHAAHGYLLHEFFSPISNKRDDGYGGDLKGRMRFLLEVSAAVRDVWPQERPMGARISGSDWLGEGATPEDAVVLARELKAIGLDYVCVSSGGIVPRAPIRSGSGYQVPFAARVRKETGVVTCSVGMIADPVQAEEIIASGQADMVALARAFLDNPRWVWHAAQRLGVEIAYPPQYERAHPKAWSGAKLARSSERAPSVA